MFLFKGMWNVAQVSLGKLEGEMGRLFCISNYIEVAFTWIQPKKSFISNIKGNFTRWFLLCKYLDLQRQYCHFFISPWIIPTKCNSLCSLKNWFVPHILLNKGAPNACWLAFHLKCKIGHWVLGTAAGLPGSCWQEAEPAQNWPRFPRSVWLALICPLTQPARLGATDLVTSAPICSVGMLCVPSCPDVRMYQKTFLDFSSVPSSLEKCSCLRCVCPICFCCLLAKINSGPVCVCISLFLTNGYP